MSSLEVNKELEKSKDEDKEAQKPSKSDFTKREALTLGVGILIIALIIFGLAFFAMKGGPKDLDKIHKDNLNQGDSEKSLVYNGFSFVKLADPRTDREFWYTQYQVGGNIFDIPMHYNPKEVEHVPIINVAPLQEREYSLFYITIEPTNESKPYLGVAVSELSKKFTEIKQYPIVAACTKNETVGCQEREIITCENTKNNIVIEFNDQEEEPRVLVNDNCITLVGNNETLLQSVDRFIYSFLGIMN